MGAFEVLERDGLARRGRLETPHGPIETPALLPVVHPDPSRQPVPPAEMRTRLGVRAVIASAYITWRTPPLREVAERQGIHGLLQFDGPIMTDSGAFQQHAYGSVEVGPEEILAFQNTIGSDIATVLDRFTEPESDHEEAEAALTLTQERATAARSQREGLLAVPVQGGSHADLRARSAAGASAVADVLAVGGVVPLFEQYPVPRTRPCPRRRAAPAEPGRRGSPVRNGPPDDVRVRGALGGRPARLLGVPQVRTTGESAVPRGERRDRRSPRGGLPLLPVRRNAAHRGRAPTCVRTGAAHRLP